jgi:hypothetical protein
MKEVDRKSFVHFLLICSPQQFKCTLKTLTKNQLQVIVEIIFNMMKGICPISDKNKTKQYKRKRLIREVILPKLTPEQRKRRLKKHKRVLPIFLEACLKHGP